MSEAQSEAQATAPQIAVSLDPISLPLNGQALIEASAGTGKTYTLAALYLRLLLGHGGQPSLDVDQILVVTFTEAATKELRERIRSRIQEARSAFIVGRSQDPFITELMAQQDDHHSAIIDLEYAASEMDQAAIFTIHGFCQRMLKQHAFESGANFNAELLSDDSDLVRQALLDYWRSEIYGRDDRLVQEILKCYADPDRLLAELRGYIGLSGLQLLPDYSDFPLHERWREFVESESKLQRQLYRVLHSDQAEDDLLSIIQSSSVDKRSYSKKNLPNWLNKLLDFAEGGSTPWKELAKFSQSHLIEKSKTAEIPEHEIFTEIEHFCDSEIPVKSVIFCRALVRLRAKLSEEKKARQKLSFDDLLSTLAQALTGEVGAALAQGIRKQYPFALIDEFQDTDPQQYQIFSIIYDQSAQERSGLLMIGDPKQSIYAFRGADIFTYMAARRQVERHYTLDTNWRSSVAMVEATNTLFNRASSAFIYEQDIPFFPVSAVDKGKTGLTLHGKKCPALTLWLNSQSMNNDQYLQFYATHCASQIESMLQQGRLNEQSLTPSNIAVLVRDRKEAALIQQALLQVNIDSVFMSNRDNVFSTVIAREMVYILKAINEPTNERFVRTALATDIFQLTSLELDHLNEDEVAWEALVEEFINYRIVWGRAGVLAMLHLLLQQRNLAQRWLCLNDGERKLTDFLHLSELLQQMSGELESHEALIRWLQDRRAVQAGQSEEQQLRLDSDRSRVTVITIHKSKGLEYDIVYLPFVSRYRQTKGLMFHDEQGQATLDLQAKEYRDQVVEEQLAEDLRLLYVAITRAVYGCFIGFSDVQLRGKSVWPLTAIGYLLTQLKAAEALTVSQSTTLSEYLQMLADSSESIVLCDLQKNTLQQADLFAFDRSPVTVENSPLFAAKAFRRQLDYSWRVTSYSALSRNALHAPSLPSTKLDLEVFEQEDEEDIVEVLEQSIFTFAKGAIAGTFLHSIYEEIDFSSADREPLIEVLQRRLPLTGYDLEWTDILADFIWQSLDVNLVAREKENIVDTFSLRQITVQQRLVEMEFVLPFKVIHCSQINNLLRRYEPLSKRAGELNFSRVSGMLKGFIDLTLRHNNKYYIVDYKSNFLGHSIDDYSQESIEQAIIDHRYDFQYILYTLALHRLLRTRLVDYDYDQHIGGVFYLFLRGMNPASDTGVFYSKPDRRLIESLDAMFETGSEPDA